MHTLTYTVIREAETLVDFLTPCKIPIWFPDSLSTM